MIGNLDEAIRTLLTGALPSLLSGGPPGPPPPVSLSIQDGVFTLDPSSNEAPTSEPRPDDRLDNFPFNPAAPPANFTLTQSPYPGPRRVRLTTSLGDRITLQTSEVIWDALDTRVFTLSLRPTHDLANVTGVQVLYGVTAVFTTLKALQTFTVTLQSDNAVQLEQAEALALGVMELNRQTLIDQSPANYASGDYGALVTVKSFKLAQGSSPAANQRQFSFEAEIELKASRALEEGEGAPITRIRTPGRPLDPDRPVDIFIDVEA
jgi:hypothetical protein